MPQKQNAFYEKRQRDREVVQVGRNSFDFVVVRQLEETVEEEKGKHGHVLEKIYICLGGFSHFFLTLLRKIFAFFCCG